MGYYTNAYLRWRIEWKYAILLLQKFFLQEEQNGGIL